MTKLNKKGSLPDYIGGQHCPILLTSMGIVTNLIKISSWQSSKTKKSRLKTALKNWENIVRIIHPKLTLKFLKKLS